jgi:transcription elongation factor Elf1
VKTKKYICGVCEKENTVADEGRGIQYHECESCGHVHSLIFSQLPEDQVAILPDYFYKWPA